MALPARSAHDHHGHDHHGHDHGHHDHAHRDHGHGHSHALPDNRRRLAWAIALTVGFMGVEAVGGWLAGSLALLADAGHMLTDAGALALAWYAERATARPADAQRTYGHHRFPVIAAFVNGLTLLAVIGWIGIEAVWRLAAPQPVMGLPIMAVAATGLMVNGIVFLVLHGTDRDNLNLRGALLHVLGDLLGSVAALVAGGIVLLTGWTAADPLLSLLIVALILRSSWALVRGSAHILMQGAPAHLDTGRVREALMAGVAGLIDVHHIHAWSLSSGRSVVTLHARLRPETDGDGALAGIQAILADDFNVADATIQIERGAYAEGAECQMVASVSTHRHPRA
jgi:cobalt-zinc-cadmium efflux system protein